MADTYSLREVADKIGVTLDTMYRTRQWRHDHDGLPRPVSERGKLRFERTGFDAWLLRYHPMRPPAPANDPAQVPDPATDQAHRLRLALAYAAPKPLPPLDRQRRRA